MELPVAAKAGQEVPSGGYFDLDRFDRAVIPTANRQIWVVRVQDGPCGPGLERQRVYDLSADIPEDDSIVSALPDFLGRLWFVTAQGLVGVIGPLQGVAKTVWLPGERIANSFAVDETGGVFIASDHALDPFDSLDRQASSHMARTIRTRRPGQTRAVQPGYRNDTNTDWTPLCRDYRQRRSLYARLGLPSRPPKQQCPAGLQPPGLWCEPGCHGETRLSPLTIRLSWKTIMATPCQMPSRAVRIPPGE